MIPLFEKNATKHTLIESCQTSKEHNSSLSTKTSMDWILDEKGSSSKNIFITWIVLEGTSSYIIMRGCDVTD